MTTSNVLNIRDPGMMAFDGIATFYGRTLTAGTGISISNGTGIGGNPVITATGAGTDYHVARYIVSAGGASDGANYTDIQTAMDAAFATGFQQTVFIQPGTYTTDLTLYPGINLCANVCDAGWAIQNTSGYIPNVLIIGKLTANDFNSTTLSCNISGICIKTNSDFALVISGTLNTNVSLNECMLIGSNNNIVSGSNSAGKLVLTNCFGDLQTTGITYFASTNNCSWFISKCLFFNSGGSSTASTFANGSNLTIRWSHIAFPITTTNSAATNCYENLHTQTISIDSSNANEFVNCSFKTMTSTSMVIGSTATVTVTSADFNSSNVAVISGAGALIYGGVVFSGSSSAITVSTQTPIPWPVLQGGTGVSTMTTAYAPVCAGTTATGALQVASTGLATSGFVLTSNGSSALPSFQAAAGGGLTWTVVTGTTQAAVTGNGYIANNAGTTVITLPATSVVGDTVWATGINNATGWKIAQNAGNQIFFGGASTTAGATGYLQSAATRDSVTLVCTTVNANWQVVNSVGNITVF